MLFVMCNIKTGYLRINYYCCKKIVFHGFFVMRLKYVNV